MAELNTFTKFTAQKSVCMKINIYYSRSRRNGQNQSSGQQPFSLSFPIFFFFSFIVFPYAIDKWSSSDGYDDNNRHYVLNHWSSIKVIWLKSIKPPFYLFRNISEDFIL